MARRITIEFLGNDKSLGSTADQVDGRMGKLESRFDKVGAAAGKILAGGLLAGGAAAVKMAQGAAEDDAAASKLANTLKNATGATKGQVAAAEQWISAQGKSLGVADDELRPALGRLAVAAGDVGKAQELSSLAMDVSAGSGKSLEAVSTALAKAQNGNVGALGKLGVATKDAEGKTLSLDEITGNLAKTYNGSAAKAADTTAGKQKKMQVAFGELQEEIGAKLLPVMSRLAEWGLKTVDWMDRNRKTVGVLLGGLAGLLGVMVAVSAASKVSAAVTAAWSIAQGAHAAITGADTAALTANSIAMKTHSVVSKLAAAGQWLLNAALTANPIGLVVIAIAALVAGLVIAYKKSETFRNIVNGAFDAVLGVVKGVWGWIKTKWGELQAVLTGVFIVAGAAIGRVWDSIKGGATAAKNWVTGRFNDLVGVLTGLPGRIGRAASGMWDGIRDAFRSVINWIIRKWNSLSFSLPSVNVPGFGKVGGFTLSTPNIPELAKGGIVKSTPGGVLARIAEGGRDEAVVPLPKRGGNPLGGGDTYHIHLHGVVDKQGAAREIRDLLLRHKRQLGLANLGIG